jgi:hypothetical protein
MPKDTEKVIPEVVPEVTPEQLRKDLLLAMESDDANSCIRILQAMSNVQRGTVSEEEKIKLFSILGTLTDEQSIVLSYCFQHGILKISDDNFLSADEERKLEALKTMRDNPDMGEFYAPNKENIDAQITLLSSKVKDTDFNLRKREFSKESVEVCEKYAKRVRAYYDFTGSHVLPVSLVPKTSGRAPIAPKSER